MPNASRSGDSNSSGGWGRPPDRPSIATASPSRSMGSTWELRSATRPPAGRPAAWRRSTLRRAPSICDADPDPMVRTPRRWCLTTTSTRSRSRRAFSGQATGSQIWAWWGPAASPRRERCSCGRRPPAARPGSRFGATARRCRRRLDGLPPGWTAAGWPSRARQVRARHTSARRWSSSWSGSDGRSGSRPTAIESSATCWIPSRGEPRRPASWSGSGRRPTDRAIAHPTPRSLTPSTTPCSMPLARAT